MSVNELLIRQKKHLKAEGSFTRPPSHNMHFWDRMAQSVSSLAIKQLTWILVCWDIISPRFEKRRKKEKKVSLRQSLFHQQSRGKQKKAKNICHLQFISLCCLGTSGLPVTFSQILNAKLFKIMEENIKQNWHELGFGHVDHRLCSCYTQH